MQHVRRVHDGEEQRSTFTELFFDLVFVLVVTQLSALLYRDLTLAGFAKAGFLLLVAWWAWIYTTWTTNWFDPDATPVRVVLLAGMLASLIGAVAIPDAFGDRALLFVAGYVGMQTVRNAFVVVGSDRDDPLHPALVRIFWWNAWVGLLWLAGALLHGEARIAVWLLALVCDYAGPLVGHWTPGLGRTRPSEWDIEPSHFVERIELFLMIALGEAIVASGVTASRLDLSTGHVAALMVSFGITVALWWLYFDFHAERTLDRLRDAAEERGRLGRELTYLHIPFIAGVILAAVGSELAITHPGGELGAAELIALGGGPVLYLLGSVVFKARVLRVPVTRRLAATIAVVGAALLAAVIPTLAAWTLVLAVLTTLAAAERWERTRPGRAGVATPGAVAG